MQTILDIRGLTKIYPGRGNSPSVTALDNADLSIRKGEIFALLGPNGAGKTTLIGSVCGTVKPTGGTIHAFGVDLRSGWRGVRSRIGLVPQELGFDPFDEVLRAVTYSRGLFGLPANPGRIEEVLRALSLWDKRNQRIRELSGGMKRRVLIAKALAHDPELLFLDEPTAGVDVELRRDMWRQIDALRETGVTVILTTHYLEEAEEMADRIGVIDHGRVMLVEEKGELMRRMGRSEIHFGLNQPLSSLPPALTDSGLQIVDGGNGLCWRGGGEGIAADRMVAILSRQLIEAGVSYDAISVKDSSLEDIFVDLVEGRA